jgi:chemotaxis protein MotB
MAEEQIDKDQPGFSPIVQSKQGSNNLWLVIFTDLVALMLAFFVLLFSMSTVKLSDWKSLVQSLSETLSPEEKKKIPVAQSNFNIESVFRGEASNLDYLMSIVSEAIDGDQLLSRGRIVRLEDRLMIVMPGDVLFKSNGAELSDSGRKALFVLGGVLRNIDNEIGINGHTGTVSLGQSGYTSNWELSTALASSIANTLRQSGYPRPITAFGYAANRPKPLKGFSANEENALAWRLEIVIRPEAGGL